MKRVPDPLAEERARAVEIVAIGLPVLVQAVVMTLFLGMCAAWIIILATEIPA